MRLALITLVVRDYDEAIAWFCGMLGFALVEDTVLSPNKRWVVVAPESGAALLLARATNAAQHAAIGNQTGGRVAFFLHTDDLSRDYAALTAKGVRFMRDPEDQDYGRVAVFEDIYGNMWDLIEPKP